MKNNNNNVDEEFSLLTAIYYVIIKYIDNCYWLFYIQDKLVFYFGQGTFWYQTKN